MIDGSPASVLALKALIGFTGHTHAIDDVAGLTAALAGKAASSHPHSAADINSGTLDVARFANNALGNVKLAKAPAFTLKGNRTALTADLEDIDAALVASLIGLGSVNNTSDANKPVSTAQAAAIALKANAAQTITGAGLATGGGSLAANRTITVPAAVAADFLGSTDATKALTTKAVWDAGALVNLTDTTTIAVNMATGINFAVTIAGNRTLGNPTNPIVGQTGLIYITSSGAGRTLAFGANWKFPGGEAPSKTPAASSVDVLAYHVRTASLITCSWLGDVK